MRIISALHACLNAYGSRPGSWQGLHEARSGPRMGGRAAHQPLPGAGAGIGKRLSSARPHSPPESRAASNRVPVPGQSRSWLPAHAPQQIKLLLRCLICSAQVTHVKSCREWATIALPW